MSSVHHNKKQREFVEDHVLAELEKNYMGRMGRWLPQLTFDYIRRRLKKDARRLASQFGFESVSEEQICTWVDEIFTQIDQFKPHLRTLEESIDHIQLSLTTGKLSSTSNNSQWVGHQLVRARTVLPDKSAFPDEALLLAYRTYIVDTLTPVRLERRPQRIDLDAEHQKTETIGRAHLTKMLDQYKKRGRPNLDLIKEMIKLGMEQMIKPPDTEELRVALATSSFGAKATSISKIKRAYQMSIKNIADDFMLLRFGRVLEEHSTEGLIRRRFIDLIQMFLNDIQQFIGLLANEIPTQAHQWTTDASIGNIFHPLTHIDQWTWLLEKWKTALRTIPLRLVHLGAFGRIARTTIGIAISRLYAVAESNEQLDEIGTQLFAAVQMGFYYGVAYALVDGLQDDREKTEQNTDLDQWLVEMENVLCGGNLDRSHLPRLPITSLFVETFDCLVQLTSANSAMQETFTDLALLLRAQRFDKKNIDVAQSDDVDLYIGPLMKAHFTYTTTGLLTGIPMIHVQERLWTMPFLGQLTDDCRDFGEDRLTKSLTPVTYFAQHRDSILNPFFIFLFVCEDVYLQSNREPNAGAFLGRRILRTLRALQTDLSEFLDIFVAKSDPQLYTYALSLKSLFSNVTDPEKSIFRSMNKIALRYSLTNRCLETFTYDHLPLIEQTLAIDASSEGDDDAKRLLVLALNHSLKAGGKRLRPLLLFMVAQQFSIDIERLLPLARALEYLHTSSLIFDDLPAQDNATLRRGQPTLHMPISDDDEIPPSLTEGRAQLAAIDLIAHAIYLVSVDLARKRFTDQSINRVAAELAQSMHQLCQGQFLDLYSARVRTTRAVQLMSLTELDHIAELKTGKAIAVVLVCPAMLAERTVSEVSIARLRELGRIIGILFQMKDDLLDVEGDTNELGKKTRIDQENHTITYPKLLGVNGTRDRIVAMRRQAEQIVAEIWPQAGTIKDLIRYICERSK